MLFSVRALVAALLVLLSGACAHRRAAPAMETSGFLDDYALLRDGGPNEVWRVYRSPETNWPAYDQVLLEPVTLWRSGRKSLEPVPKGAPPPLGPACPGPGPTRLCDGPPFAGRPGPGGG